MAVEVQLEAGEALLIIDMLHDFCERSGALYVEGVKEIVPKIQQLIDKARKSHLPVIYICDAHRKDDAEFEIFPPHAILHTWGAQIIKELAPQPSDYIVLKRRYCGFYQTDLELLLRECNVTKLIITGILTDICLYFTVASAAMRNFKVVVPSEATCALTPQNKEWALNQLKRLFKIEII